MVKAIKVKAIIGELDIATGRGVGQILAEDSDIELLGGDLDRQPLEVLISGQAPDVAVIGDTATAVPAMLRRLKVAHPALNVVVLAHEPSRAYAFNLLACGAAACISRDSSADVILTAVHLAADGKQLVVCSSPKAHALQTVELSALTLREQEVLSYLRRDATNAEVAAALHIGVETVRTHAANIYRKLGVRGRRHL
jgi:DNA-binding NarL/FixJ family response regulator